MLNKTESKECERAGNGRAGDFVAGFRDLTFFRSGALSGDFPTSACRSKVIQSGQLLQLPVNTYRWNVLRIRISV